MQVVQGSAEITGLGLGFGTDEIDLSQTDVGHTDIFIIHLCITVIIKQPLVFAVA